jgi:hypothetical protein
MATIPEIIALLSQSKLDVLKAGETASLEIAKQCRFQFF